MMSLNQLKQALDELCERDPQTALALASRIQRKLQPGFPQPLTFLHQALVDRMLQGPPDEEIQKIREALSSKIPEEKIEEYIAELRKPGLREGESFGGLHLEDLVTYAEVLFRQGVGRFIWEVEFENLEDDHLTLTIQKLDKAHWQQG